MGYETQQREGKTGVPSEEVIPRAITGSPVASASRLPYVAPQLRYLGKVADLTFGTVGSISDGGTHTGHNLKV